MKTTVTHPVYDRHGITVFEGDNLAVLRAMPDASVDAVVTDPPAGIRFMNRAWDDDMGGRHSWVAWLSERMAEALRVLKPGGHALVWAIPRTSHWTAWALEDAGFEVRDCLVHLFGSGFPKSLDVGKAIDATELHGGSNSRRIKAANASRPGEARTRTSTVNNGIVGEGRGEKITRDEPATDAARQWEGWGTALKPAAEHWWWVRKPFNTVPWDEGLISEVHHSLGALLWLSLSPAKRASLSSPSSHHAQRDQPQCVSALAAAALVMSPDASEKTATFSSPETASTFLSIGSSWNVIWDALSDPTKTCTTATRSSTTTALRILCSLLAPITSPSTMPRCGCPTSGPESPATDAAESSTGEWMRWLHTLTRTAPENASSALARSADAVLAGIAADLSSGTVSERPSARPSATPTIGETTDATTPSPTDVSDRPAAEHWWLVRKPLTSTVAANVQQHGTGALNIAATRVAASATDQQAMQRANSPGSGRFNPTRSQPGAMGRTNASTPYDPSAGRWPSNAVFSHSPMCGERCVEECPVAELDRQSGQQRDGIAVNRNRPGGTYQAPSAYGVYGNPAAPDQGYGGEGGASRFFPVFKWEAKAPTAERPKVGGKAWPTVKPLGLMRWLVRLVTPPGGVVLDLFCGTGTTLHAARAEGFRAIGIDADPDAIALTVSRLDGYREPVAADPVTGVAEPMDLLDLLDGDDGGEAA